MAWLTMQERRSILSGPGQITDAPKGISDSFAILKQDRKSTRLNSSHWNKSRMPSSA